MAKPRLRLITKKQLHALEDLLYDIHRAVIRASYERIEDWNGPLPDNYHEDVALEHARATADMLKPYISRNRFAMRYTMAELDSPPYDEDEEKSD
jgi:hypothetical protein